MLWNMDAPSSFGGFISFRFDLDRFDSLQKFYSTHKTLKQKENHKNKHEMKQ